MPRKKRPPIPQSVRQGPAKPSTPHSRAKVDKEPRDIQDRLAVYFYYVPILMVSYYVIKGNVTDRGGHLAVHHWPMIITMLVFLAIGPYYLRVMKAVRMKLQLPKK